MNRVAKNMDSVFANCTASELDFEVMFDDDDSLIDLVAGVNEAGELVTGPNPEDTYEFQLDEDGNDPLTDKDDAKQREGVLKNTEGSHEGSTKDPDEKFESPEGMANQITGSATSAEHTSDKDEAKDAEQKALTNESNTANPDGPLTDDDEKEREGKVAEASDICEKCGKPMNECSCGKSGIKESIIAKLLANKEVVKESDNIDTSMAKTDSATAAENKKLEQEAQKNMKIDSSTPSTSSNIKESIIAKIIEANVEKRTDDTFEAELRREGNKEDTLTDKDDEELRAGKEKYSSNQVEAIKQKIIGAAQEAVNTNIETDTTFEKELAGAKESPIDDEESDDLRDGSEKYASEYKEGIKQKIIGAAQESAMTNDLRDRIIAAYMEADEAAGDTSITASADKSESVPDTIQTNAASNNIVPDVETQSSDGLAPATEEAELIKAKLLAAYKEDVNPDVDETTKVEESTSEIIKRKILEASIDSVDFDDDDEDIEAIANGEGDLAGDLNLSVDYDDDELIDMAISGKI